MNVFPTWTNKVIFVLRYHIVLYSIKSLDRLPNNRFGIVHLEIRYELILFVIISLKEIPLFAYCSYF